jgi:hypothetical protein
MKRNITLAVCILLLLSIVGCTFPLARPMPLGTGVVYSNVKFSDDGYPVNDSLVGSRKGKASMSEILCCFATGNASTTRAAQDAGIKKIKTVEHEYFNVLLIYQSYTTHVTGE